ncbi:MAG TPA: FKBP-type peptidyl-prolyl cis-trans isomerase [Chitinophagaceae bacterium]|nr:FKBP-type peptidyl-prolyl cis-trans isomerase [Chitinophagaceae bacterium]
MRTIRIFSVLALASAMIAGCSQTSLKKTPGGMPYQVFSSKDTQKVEVGDFIKASYIYKVNDSVLFDSHNSMPVYIPVMAQTQPYDISEVWSGLKLGDSVVATQMLDTFIKRMPENIPPQFKKGDRIRIFAKILGIFKNDSLMNVDKKKTFDAFAANEVVVVENYLKEKKITAQKTPSGAFVEYKNPGTGNNVDSGKYVTVNYTGTTFAGTKFDSNTDTAFHHTEPLGFVVGAGQMIKGFDEGVRLMKPGGSARIYIPSLLAYGDRPGTPLIKPFEHLIFDVQVLEVKDAPPAVKDIPPPPPPTEKIDAHQH